MPAMGGAHATGTESIVRCTACGKPNRVRPTAHGTPRCGACKAPLAWFVEADGPSFDDEVRASVPVLVDLWAPWCAPCRQMGAVLEQLARDRAGRLKVVKVDVDRAPDVAARFGVQAIPLLVLLQDGRELARLAGAAPPARLTAWLNSRLTLAASTR